MRSGGEKKKKLPSNAATVYIHSKINVDKYVEWMNRAIQTALASERGEKKKEKEKKERSERACRSMIARDYGVCANLRVSIIAETERGRTALSSKVKGKYNPCRGEFAQDLILARWRARVSVINFRRVRFSARRPIVVASSVHP